jgi:outer membrane lipoprotein LolB
MLLPRALFMAALAALVLLTACAVPPAANDIPSANRWRGRLAITVQTNSLAQTPAQSMTAGFELSGSPQTGEFTLYTPLGSTAAALSWNARSATLRSAGESREFESLQALIRHTTGAELPLAALFAWLAGDNAEVAGWQADLSQHAAGRILARRTEAGSETQIRLILEK